jgi:hypothetical protein
MAVITFLCVCHRYRCEKIVVMQLENSRSNDQVLIRHQLFLAEVSGVNILFL